MKQQLIKLLKVIIPVGIGIYLTWFFYSSLSPKEKQAIPNAFANANYLWVFLSVFIAWLGHVSRAYRWKFMMEPLGYKPKLVNLYHATMIGYVINYTIPRSGEIARPGFLAKKENLPFDKIFGTVVAERIIDLVMIMAIMGITSFMVGSSVIDDLTKNFDTTLVLDATIEVSDFEKTILKDGTVGFRALSDISPELKKEYLVTTINKEEVIDMALSLQKYQGQEVSVKGKRPEGSNTLLYLIAIGGIVVGATLFLIKKIRNVIISKIMGIWDGVKTIFTMKKRIPFIFHTLFIWFTYIFMMWTMAQGVEGMEGLTPKAMMVAFVVGAVAIAVTPGGIGLYPIFVTGALVYFGFSKDIASGYSIMMWVVQTIFLVVAGIYSLYAINIKFSNAEIEEKMAQEN